MGQSRQREDAGRQASSNKTLRGISPKGKSGFALGDKQLIADELKGVRAF